MKLKRVEWLKLRQLLHTINNVRMKGRGKSELMIHFQRRYSQTELTELDLEKEQAKLRPNQRLLLKEVHVKLDHEGVKLYLIIHQFISHLRKLPPSAPLKFLNQDIRAKYRRPLRKSQRHRQPTCLLSRSTAIRQLD